MSITALGRTASAAALGWLLGAAISLDYDISEAASASECRGAGSVCIGMGPVIGFAAAVAAVVLVCWIGFAILRIRPLVITVPVGIASMILVTYAYLDVAAPLQYPQPVRLHPLPVYALATALALALPTAVARTKP